MILPTPEFDPMFAQDGIPFREKMIRYIQREFSDLLGPCVYLLESEGGLDILSRVVHSRGEEQSLPKVAPSPLREAA